MTLTKRACIWIVFLVIVVCNVDVVIIPTLITRTLTFTFFRMKSVDLHWLIPHLKFWQIYGIAVVSSWSGCFYCWYFFGRKSVLLTKLTAMKREIALVLSDTEFVIRLRFILTRYFSWASWILTHKERTLKIIKIGGALGALAIGAFPDFPGARGTTILICRTANLRTGFLALLAGDLIKNFYVVFGWTRILR